MNTNNLLLNIIKTAFLTLLFGLIYTQQPLFHSNQNTYFLHGLAHAGYGFLKYDWLANTTDTFPIFSALVKYTHLFLNIRMFYFYQLVIQGIYIVSLLGIANALVDLKSSKAKALVFLTIVFLIHSSAISEFLLNNFNLDQVWVLTTGVAGQLILGSYTQPSAFGVSLILSIYLFLKDKHYWAVVFSSLAALMHFSYMTGAAMITLGYIVIIAHKDRNFAKAALMGIIVLIIVLPNLLFVKSNFSPTSPEIWAKSLKIMMHSRIPHHADPATWFSTSVVAKAIIAITALFLIRKTRLFFVFLFTFAFIVVGSIAQIIGGSASLGMLFPWRISALLVPVSTVIIAANFCNYLFSKCDSLLAPKNRLINALSYIIIVILLLGGIWKTRSDFIKLSTRTDLKMMNFVRANKEKDDVYLIPLNMDKFRLYTGAPILIDYKSHPYKDSEVLEWHERAEIAQKFYDELENSPMISSEILQELIEHFSVSHIVVEFKGNVSNLTKLNEVYSDNYYKIFEVSSPYGLK